MNTYTIYLIPRTMKVAEATPENLNIALYEDVPGEEVGAILDQLRHPHNLTAAAVCNRTGRITRRTVREGRRKLPRVTNVTPLTRNAVTALVIWKREGTVAA